MQVVLENQCDYFLELRLGADTDSVPLSNDRVTADLAELVEEQFTNGVLAGKLPAAPETIVAHIEPVYSQEPVVEAIDIRLTAISNGHDTVLSQRYQCGRWVRTAQRKVTTLRSEGSLAVDEPTYRMLIASRTDEATVAPPVIVPPSIDEATLEQCGVRALGEGRLAPDRPVLVNLQFESEAVAQCEQSGVIEIGGAVLGRTIRLAKPLTGTETPVVTVLSTIVFDSRHSGSETRFHFHPAALAEAEQIANMRGLGEKVLTVYHSHGWAGHCGNCNANPDCPLAESTPSLHDYEQLLEQLFTSKTTLLPIAGRKLGAEGQRPVLQVHAWQRGEMRPIHWRRYSA